MAGEFPFGEVERQICYEFRDKRLLKQAFTHSSYANENDCQSNERMETFGDAVLEFLSTKYLFNRYPDKDDGQLSKARASVISAVTLKKALNALDVSRYLLMSHGAKIIKKNSFKLDSNLYESLLCAVYLDGGIENAEKFVLSTLSPFMDNVDALVKTDSLSAVNEHCQKNKIKMEWQIEQSGPDHRPSFSAALLFDGKKVAVGVGGSTHKAQQAAAKNAVENLHIG